MELAEITNPVPAGSASRSSALGLAENFETFLTLLTTQLRNQDPLEPMKSSDFTEQLVLFTGVEQAIATNTKLENLVSLLQAQRAASAVGYLGKAVTIVGETAQLANGRAEWHYKLPRDAQFTAIEVVNADGQIVHTALGAGSAGAYRFEWNGIGQNDLPEPNGLYTIHIVATDADGAPIAVETGRTGLVTAVENVNGEQVLVVGDERIPLSQVVAVSEPDPESTPEPELFDLFGEVL